MKRTLIVAFSAEIRRRRVEQGLMLGEIGSRSGLSPNYIGQVARGVCEASLSTVEKLAWGLGVEPGVLFGAQRFSAAALEAGRCIDAIKDRGARAAMMKLMRVLDRNARGKARAKKTAKRAKRTR